MSIESCDESVRQPRLRLLRLLSPRAVVMAVACGALLLGALLVASGATGEPARAAPLAGGANATPTLCPPPIANACYTRTPTATPTRPPLTIRDPGLPRDLEIVPATPRTHIIIVLPTATPTPYRHGPYNNLSNPGFYQPTPTPTP